MIDKLAACAFSIVILFAGAGASAAAPFPPGSPQAELIGFQLAVYYTAAPAGDPLSAMRTLAARLPALAVVKQLPDRPTGMMLSGRMEMDVQANYAPPSPVALGYFGRGLSKEQVAALQRSQQALLLNFSHPKKFTLEALRNAYGLAEQLARQTGGLLWDEETRELFTPDKWHELRLANWTGAVPEVPKHITIHSYKSGVLVRAVTLGMGKFGLPDIVVDQFPWSSDNSVGNLINSLAQRLAEGAPVASSGHLDLDFKAIANEAMRERELAELRPNSPSLAKLALVQGTWEEGDPRNRLAEITFSRYPGPDAPARQDAMLSALFGGDDKVKQIRHNDELRAESLRAKKKLAALQGDFQRGLQPGEYIQVKAPFATTSGGREWMWVEISAWKDTELAGLLKNEPRDVPGLHAGQAVKVRLDDVFDYLHHFADGKEDGGTTTAIILKMKAAN